MAHWESLAAIDFFTTEIYTLLGLTRYMVPVRMAEGGASFGYMTPAARVATCLA